MRPTHCGLALFMSLAAASAATAGERFVETGPYGYGGGYGFADGAIAGTYIGAPLTRFPRPSEIVPPAWGYGTYGLPTITGIRQAPTAAPTLTVINGTGTAPRRTVAPARFVSRGGDGRRANDAGASDPNQSGVRVISVTVPRH